MDLVLAKLCENLVDVIQETFTKKYYIVGITQSKRRHIYLIFRKKDASCCMKKKRHFTPLLLHQNFLGKGMVLLFPLQAFGLIYLKPSVYQFLPQQ